MPVRFKPSNQRQFTRKEESIMEKSPERRPATQEEIREVLRSSMGKQDTPPKNTRLP